jgi:hypothetical protein
MVLLSGIPTAFELPPAPAPLADAPPVIEAEPVPVIEASPMIEAAPPAAEALPPPPPLPRPRRRRALTFAFAGVVLLAGAGGALAGLMSRWRGPSHPAARPVAVIATFTDGTGGCPGFPSTFSKQYTLTRVGDGVRLFQPVALDAVAGAVSPDGALFLHNGLEVYEGAITAAGTSGTYRVLDPRSRCTETYRFSWPPGPPGPPG